LVFVIEEMVKAEKFPARLSLVVVSVGVREGGLLLAKNLGLMDGKVGS